MIVKLYLACLVFGSAYIFVSLLIDKLFAFFDFDFNAKFFALPLNPFTIITYVTSFGFSGLMTFRFLPGFLSLVPSFFLAYFIAKFFYESVYLRRKKRTCPALPIEVSVMEEIEAGGVGKIAYMLDGKVVTLKAREKQNGNGIAKGRKVMLFDIIDNVGYVMESVAESGKLGHV